MIVCDCEIDMKAFKAGALSSGECKTSNENSESKNVFHLLFTLLLLRLAEP